MSEQETGDGALLGSIIIVTLIVVGGAYMARNKMAEIRQERNNAANAISSSDDLDTIQTDLNNNSDINGIDKNLQ